MKKLRMLRKLQRIRIGGFSFLKGISCFMAFTLLFVSCSPDSLTEYEELSTDNVLIDVNGDGTELYHALEIFRTFKYAQDFQSNDEALEYALGEESYNETAALRQDLAVQIELYKSLGFEDYLSSAQSQLGLSENMKNWLLLYKTNLENFLESKPDADMVDAFFSNANNFIDSSPYSNDELACIETILSNSRGLSKYYFLHYGDTNSDSSTADLRDPDCSILEGILCTLLLAALTAVLVVLVFKITFALASLLTANPGDYVHGIATFSGFSGFFFGLAAMINGFFEWCCGKEEEILCSPPLGSTIKELGCNSFQIMLYGAGNYINTAWTNENATPALAITPTPLLAFTVPDPNEISTLSANTTCIEYPSLESSSYEYSTSDLMNQIDVQWAVQPPSTINISNMPDPNYPPPVQMSVSANSVVGVNSANYSYSWSITGSHTITSYANNAYINLDINDLGQIIVDVEVTNLCSGATQLLNATTYLIP